ncbi:hypothetical protein A0O21_04170 [Streptococcus pantholopis]|uniref:Uncharacterized protein n=2 Tax=Streptococcus pantholopis TaxID=1811193 RepID=A0A172QAD2_9STRE|nr:hypothetical protein A0O21_04170 [Streptococcus pantholopis]
MAIEKVNQLYKHGFRLYEEQIATYIKENYSGISKIEFSPIFVDGDGRFTMRTVNVVPVIYDEEGNKAYLGRKVESVHHVTYGIGADLTLQFDSFGNEIIELVGQEGVIDVSNYDELPDKAIRKEDKGLDDNMNTLIKYNKLKNVKKSSQGSPKIDITYNLEIKKGEHWKWH